MTKQLTYYLDHRVYRDGERQPARESRAIPPLAANLPPVIAVEVKANERSKVTLARKGPVNRITGLIILGDGPVYVRCTSYGKATVYFGAYEVALVECDSKWADNVETRLAMSSPGWPRPLVADVCSYYTEANMITMAKLVQPDGVKWSGYVTHAVSMTMLDGDKRLRKHWPDTFTGGLGGDGEEPQ